MRIQKFIRLRDFKLFCVSECHIIYKNGSPTLGSYFALVGEKDYVEVLDEVNGYNPKAITKEEFYKTFKEVI